jgi:ABC-type methionine transport system ATPase subunit
MFFKHQEDPNSEHFFNSEIELQSRQNTSQLLKVILGIQIPEKYYRCPIISHLSSYFNLEVNILAAFLGNATERRGWFNLELRGTAEQIDSALVYLSVLDVPPLHLEVYNN